MTKRARKLQYALSQLAVQYLLEDRIVVAARVGLVAKTLCADPDMLDRLAKILEDS